MHLSCVCTTQIYTGSLAAMFSPPKCILSHLPEYLDFQKVQEFLRVVPKHTWYIACAMWLRQARSRGWTTSWVAVAVYVHSFKRFKVSRTSSLVPYPKKTFRIMAKVLRCHPNAFVIFCRWLQGAFQFNEGLWLCSADGQSCICGIWWWPNEWLSQGLISKSWALHVYSLQSLSFFLVLWLKFHWRLVCRHTHPECAERQVSLWLWIDLT